MKLYHLLINKPRILILNKCDMADEEANNKWTIERLLNQTEVQTPTEIESKEERTRFESIIDFPHFLLHALKVYLHKKRINDDDVNIGNDDKVKIGSAAF